jgi:hypothetical protein
MAGLKQTAVIAKWFEVNNLNYTAMDQGDNLTLILSSKHAWLFFLI